MMERFLECCSTSVQEVLRAQELGASRIELCEQLEVGGVTPGTELLEQVLRVSTIPVNVLVRPRGGDFHFNEREIRTMLGSIRLCRQLGANAVVAGALDRDGQIDTATMERLVAEAEGLRFTFHRAFDVCSDPLKSFETIMALGCDTLLTSGQKADAFQGRFLIADLVRRGRGRITVMPGGGVRPGNIEQIARDTGAEQFHASFSYFRTIEE